MVTEEKPVILPRAMTLPDFSKILGSSGKYTDAETHAWLVPGPAAWELWDSSPEGEDHLVREFAEGDESGPERISLVALPATLITCQTFWLETEDEKAVPDLVRMQCERRGVIRANEVWSHRSLTKGGGRTLAQALILHNTIPARVEVDGTPHYETHARCLELPADAVCVWKELGLICVALTVGGEPAYFQVLPHRTLGAESVRDVRSVCLLAWAHDWSPHSVECVLAGDWSDDEAGRLKGAIDIPFRKIDRFPLRLPPVPMELTPRVMQARQVRHQRMRRVRLAAIALAAIYLLFIAEQLVSVAVHSIANGRMSRELNSIMPQVQKMQTTARQLDALNPALDKKTYALEILYRSMGMLPEAGVRLTRFEIVGNRLEIGGESSTAREAFTYMKSLQDSPDLRHIQWEEPPQPIPLPNDTTRFVIRGSITGAYQEEDPNAQN